MTHRQWIGDIGFAVLLALPTAALTRPAWTGPGDRPTASVAKVQLALADRSPLQQRFSLPG